jgi:phage tail-like protein
MPLTKDAIKTGYPLPAYNYRVTIMDEDIPQVIGFSEVTGLNVEYQPVTYKHGLSFAAGLNIVPGMVQPIRLTMKKGLTKNGDFLQKWLDKSYSSPYSSSGKRDIVIDLCDETGLPIIRWKLKQALPVKLEAPSFAANGNEAAIASMELIAADLQTDYQPS